MSASTVQQQLRVGILGFGGLGRGMARMVNARRGFQLCAVADRTGFAYQENLDLETCLGCSSVTQLEKGQSSDQAILDLLTRHGEQLDVLFLALPNLPVDFYQHTVQQIAEQTPFQGVMVDALKRTEAVECLLDLDGLLRANRLLYITGAGATPGFLTTIAAVAAQSFVEVEAIDIYFGVGVSNWEQYRATIREDLLHLPGFDADKVAAMSDADIEAELDRRNGLIELVNMEHADDIILELAGVCDRSCITVGGLVDTRNARKPVSTTVTVRGKTIAGDSCQHQFTVADETTMVDNVCGPAAGFMARGVELHLRGQYGLMTSANVMPRTSAEGLARLAANQDLRQEELVTA